MDDVHNPVLAASPMYSSVPPAYIPEFVSTMMALFLTTGGCTPKMIMMALCFLPNVHQKSMQAVRDDPENAKASFAVLAWRFATSAVASGALGRGLPATYQLALSGVLLGQPWLVASTSVMTYLYHQLNTGGFIRVNLKMGWDGWKFVHPAQARDTNGLLG